MSEQNPSRNVDSAPALEAPKLKTADLPDVDDDIPSYYAPQDTLSGEHELSSLTPTQLIDVPMYQDAIDETVSTRPYISELEPISSLRLEYEGGSVTFVKQIDWLVSREYVGIRRTRGDGDCFYRSLAFAYVEGLLNSTDPALAVTSAISTLEASLPLLEQAGFQQLAYEDFYECFVSLINRILAPGSDGELLTPATLLEAFNSAEVSNSIVVYLRLLTSAQIRTDPDSYDAFLFDPEIGEPMGPREFCENFVEAMGKEADHVQITALSRALRVNISVAYLDGRQQAGSEIKVDFVEFHNNDNDIAGDSVILLYRPGHYDILDRRSELPHEAPQLLTFDRTNVA